MINIRNNVFETNSSSTHSVSLLFNEKDDFEYISPNKDGQIILNGGDFSCTELCVSSTLNKLNFIAVYITVFGNEKLKEKFESIVKEQTGAKEIIYNINMSYFNGKKANSFFSTEYRDPFCDYSDDDDYDNSYEGISLLDILEDEKMLKFFLFNKKCGIESSIES
jgi:hypothetical protein